MENWGLVTYRETALLVDKENSSSAARQRVALIVGHELAHMWFGNLVTMEWWTHLWLNEGFASWIEYLCVDHCFPEFDIWTQFVSTDFTRALELDGLRSSHPIEVPVGHPAEVDEIFNAISYSKGASIIRMLHDFIGDKDFRVGMNKYLSTHQYQNTCTEDLWRSLEEASGQPVQEVMATWTQQMGFPVLEVFQTQAGDERVLSITQHKFSADGRQDGASPLWLVPVSVSTASCPDQAVQRVVLRDRQTSIIIKGVKPEEWFKLNPGSVGYYRTQYSPDMMDSLIPAIKDMTLPPKDRLGLQNDLFALARAGQMATAEVLKVVKAFCAETNFTVWGDLASNLSGLAVILQNIDQQDNYNAFIRSLFSAIYTKLGWQKVAGEGHLDALLRSLVIGHMGRAGDQSVIEEARKRFFAHCKGTVPLPADLREPVYTTVLTHGGASEYEAMLKLISETSLQEEKLRIMKSLGAVKDEDLINRTLEYAMSDEVRSQDTVFVVAGVTGSVKGRELAWAFVKSHWSELQERYQGAFLLPRLVKCVSEKFASEEMIQDVKAFFDNHKAPGAERTVQQSLENIRLNTDHLNRDREALKEFLEKQQTVQ